MPLPFILAALAPLVAGVASVGGTIVAGVAAAGAAIAGLGASAIAAASAIGGTVLIGGITVTHLVAGAAGLFVLAGISSSIAEDARTEGYKEGYSKASREYEKKLRDQAKAFLNQWAKADEERKQYKLQRDEARELVRKLYRLLGNFEACINGMKEQGRDVESETAGFYMNLKDLAEKNSMAA